jgi:outer membrane lipoprotein-sorting protein
MTSGVAKPGPAVRCLIAAIGIAVAAVAVQAQAGKPKASARNSAGWGIADLMAAQAKRRSGTASFREERFLTSLTEPVVLKGTLSYKAPDHLVKSVTFPHVEKLVVDGDRLSIFDADGYQQGSGLVSDHPALEGAIVSMQAVLSGNLDILQRHFSVKLSGTRQAWVITLRPKSKPVQRRIIQVLVTGSNDAPSRFELRETSGDRIVIHITPQK